MGLGTFSGGGLGMGVAFTLKDQFTATSQKIKTSMKGLEGQSDLMAKRVNSSMQLMTAGAQTMMAGGILAAPFIIGISKSMEFNKTMSEVFAKARVEDQITKDILSENALKLGSDTKFTATEAAEGMTFLAMAGFETNEILEAMPGLLSLAAAGNTDLALTADIVSDALTAMGLEADQTGMFADQMAATVTRANVDIAQMGEALKYTTATAKSLGVTTAELNAMLGMVGDIGIKGSMAGTTVNRMLTHFGKITTTTKGLNALETLGLAPEQMKDAEGNLRSMTDLIPLIGDKVKALGGGQLPTFDEDGNLIKGNIAQLQLLEDMFGHTGKKAFAAFITEGGKNFEDFVATIEGDIGAADRIAEQMMDNLAGDFTKLQSITEAVFIRIGNSVESSLRPVVQVFTKLLTLFSSFIQSKIGQIVMKITAGFAAFLLVAGAVAGVVGLMQYAFYSLAPAIWSSVAPLLPFIAIGLALIGVVLALQYAFNSANPYIIAFGVALMFAMGTFGMIVGGILLIQRTIKEFNNKSADELGKQGGIIGAFEKIGGIIVGIKALFNSFNSKDGKFELSLELENKLDKVGVLQTIHNIGTWLVRAREMYIMFKDTMLKGFSKAKIIITDFLKSIEPLTGKFEKWDTLVNENTSSLEKWKKYGEYAAYTLIGVMGVLAISITLAFAPVILTIGAVIGLVWLLWEGWKYLKDNFPKTINKLIEGLGFVKTYLGALVSFVKDTFLTFWDLIQDVGGALRSLFDTGDTEGFFNDLKNSVSKFLTGIIENFAQAYKKIITFIFDFIGLPKSVQKIFFDVARAIIDTVKIAIDFLVTYWGELFRFVISYAKILATYFISIGKTILTALWKVIKAVFKYITTLIKTLFNFFVSIFSGIITFVKDTFNAIKDLIQTGDFIQFFTDMGNAIWNVLSTIGNSIYELFSGLINNALEFVGSIFSILWEYVKGIGSAIWEALKGVWEAMQIFFVNIIEKLSGTFTKFIQVGKTLVQKIREGIEGAWGDFVNWLDNKTGGLLVTLGLAEEREDRGQIVNSNQEQGDGFSMFDMITRNQTQSNTVEPVVVNNENTTTTEVVQPKIFIDSHEIANFFGQTQNREINRGGGF